MKEIWKTIEKYPDYMVSNFGRVKRKGNANLRKEKILKTSKNSGGYLKVVLSKKGHTKTFFVHRLVALSFLPNPNNYPQINHKDENKENNRIDNLEWCTSKYNSNYGTVKERTVKSLKSKGIYNKLAKVSSKKICQIDIDGNVVKVWNSMAEAKQQGFDDTSICRCCKGKYKKHKGYIWKYYAENQ